MSSLLVTATGEHEASLSYLRASCEASGLHLEPFHVGSYGGYVDKLRLLPEFLRGRTERLVVCTDGHDCLYVYPHGEQEVLRKYEALGSPSCLMMTERTCWPDVTLAQRYPEAPTPYRFLNAGGFIADREWLIEKWPLLLKPPYDTLPNDDQLRLTLGYLDGALKGMQLDTACSLFQCMDEAVQGCGGRFRNTVTDTFPAVVHWNGGRRDDMKRWWETHQ